ncbi:unnamed protein product [Dovyalis caffra]|uniref:Cytochrome P450 n=1 Tax=Dovyalis caffra TaxID=77055 RepID=A0AAV1QPL6_9ROSI|nr:unnamed protein product [Dovyalis caffra]
MKIPSNRYLLSLHPIKTNLKLYDDPLDRSMQQNAVGYFSITLFYFTIKSNKNIEKHPLPPGPKPWPIVGCLPTMLRNKSVPRWIHNLMKEMNTEIACIRLGNVHVIPVTCPDIACEFLKAKDDIFASRPNIMSAKIVSRDYLTTVLTPIGDQWTKMKKVLMTQVLSSAGHHWLYRKRVEEADHLVHYVYNQCKKVVDQEGIINLRMATQHYCANLVRKMMFNVRFLGEGMEDGGPGFEEERHVEAIFTILNHLFSFCVSDFLPSLVGFDLDGHERVMKESHGIINKYHDPIIDQRVQQWKDGTKKDVEDLLDVLITLKDDNGNPLLSKDEIKAQTTACAREAFRLHPISPFNVPHVSVVDTTVANYFIPKGSYVLLSRQGLGSNPKIWDEPLKFKPERHLSGTNNVVLTENNLRFISFSTGKRGCKGVTLGTSMTIMLFARLLQGFTWSLPPDQSCIDLTIAEDSMALAKPLLALAKPRLPPHLYPGC